MTLKELITKAVKNRDATAAGKAADVLRFHFGMTYQQSYEAVCAIEPIELQDWETLMYEADS